MTVVVRLSLKVWATQCMCSCLGLLDSVVVINVNVHVVLESSVEGKNES